MRHARDEALDALEPILVQLRERSELTERSRGTFYRKSQAFLHFHEDPAGVFVDVRLTPGDFTRMRVSTKAEQRAFMSAVRRALGP